MRLMLPNSFIDAFHVSTALLGSDGESKELALLVGIFVLEVERVGVEGGNGGVVLLPWLLALVLAHNFYIAINNFNLLISYLLPHQSMYCHISHTV